MRTLCFLIFLPFWWFAGRILHLRTRNTPPAPGQVWLQNGKRLYIDTIFDNGRIGIVTGDRWCYSSWSDSPEEWRQRVRIRGLILLKDEKPPHWVRRGK